MAILFPAWKWAAASASNCPVDPLTVPQPPLRFGSKRTARSPARCMAQPPKGTLNKSDLATYFVSSGRIAAASANGSKSERWLQTTMTALLPLIWSGVNS